MAERKQIRKKDFSSFDTYIKKVLKQIHPDTSIKGESVVEMDNFTKIVLYEIMRVVNLLTSQNDKKTVTSREVMLATRAVLPGELRRHAQTEGTKAVTKYNSSIAPNDDGSPSRTKGSMSYKAGLEFPVTRIKNSWMKNLASAPRVGDTAAVFMAAVLEYLVAETLELAGNSARDNNRVRINNRDIMQAIRNDEELNKLTKNVVMAGGVVPNIHSALKPPEKKKYTIL